MLFFPSGKFCQGAEPAIDWNAKIAYSVVVFAMLRGGVGGNFAVRIWLKCKAGCGDCPQPTYMGYAGCYSALLTVIIISLRSAVTVYLPAGTTKQPSV